MFGAGTDDMGVGRVKAPVILFDSGERFDGARLVLARYKNGSSGLTYLLSINDSGGRFPGLSQVGLSEDARPLARCRTEIQAQRLRAVLVMMQKLQPDLMFEMSDVFWEKITGHVGETVLDTKKISEMLRVHHDSYTY